MNRPKKRAIYLCALFWDFCLSMAMVCHGKPSIDHGGSSFKCRKPYGKAIWVWVNTYRDHVFVGWTSMNPSYFGGSRHGTRVLTHPPMENHDSSQVPADSQVGTWLTLPQEIWHGLNREKDYFIHWNQRWFMILLVLFWLDLCVAETETERETSKLDRKLCLILFD